MLLLKCRLRKNVGSGTAVVNMISIAYLRTLLFRDKKKVMWNVFITFLLKNAVAVIPWVNVTVLKGTFKQCKTHIANCSTAKTQFGKENGPWKCALPDCRESNYHLFLKNNETDMLWLDIGKRIYLWRHNITRKCYCYWTQFDE